MTLIKPNSRLLLLLIIDGLGKMHRMYKPVSKEKDKTQNFVTKIVSGGQTGVDRAALDVAIKLGIPHEGWCPKERKAEDGFIPSHYNLKETPSSVYEERTEWNARDSDGTLIIVKDPPMGGTSYTIEMAKKYNKPYFLLELNKKNQIDEAAAWIIDKKIHKLNVAGPRASQTDNIYNLSSDIFYQLLNNQLLSPRPSPIDPLKAEPVRAKL